MEGYLHRRRGRSLWSSWAPFYYRLSRADLRCYNTHTASTPRHVWNGAGVRLERVFDDGVRFAVAVGGGERLDLRAQSPAERGAWVRALPRTAAASRVHVQGKPKRNGSQVRE